jgi:hypothetical protein
VTVRTLVCVWLLAACPATSLGGQDARLAPGPSGSLTGQVIAADTREAVKRAVVTLSGPAGSRASAPAAPRESETDAGGRFSFDQLPPGRYRLYVRPPVGFEAFGLGQTEVVASGMTTTVTIPVKRAGVITGQVLDEDGEPAVGVPVRASRWHLAEGVRRLMAMSGGTTDDRGQFRLFGLTAGEYYVLASPMLSGRARADQRRTGPLPTFYPSAPSRETATIVPVRAGQETAGIDVRLQTGPLATVTVSVRGPDGERVPAASLVLSLRIRPAGEFVNTSRRSFPDGTTAFVSVPTGNYELAAALANVSAGRASEPALGAITTFTIDGDDRAVEMTLNGGATITGHVVIEGASPGAVEPALASTFVEARNEDGSYVSVPGSSGRRPSRVNADGTFSLIGLRGRVRIGAYGIALLTMVRLGGRDVTGTVLDLSGTERFDDLEIVCTLDVGQLEGRITAPAGRPFPRAKVVVFADDERLLYPGSRFIRVLPAIPPEDQTARPPDGYSFGVPLVPGRYRVVAFEAAEPDPQVPDLEWLRAIRANAQAVTIEARRVTAAAMSLVDPPPIAPAP